jgi:hypothetical protein
MRQEIIDLGSVGYPNVGDALVIDPGCSLATISPGVWSQVREGIWTHLATRPMTSIVLACPEDGHSHTPVHVVRAMP